MWIQREHFDELVVSRTYTREENVQRQLELRELQTRIAMLITENAHHLTVIDWFKMRLNAVERERSAWFAYVTGGGPTNRESIHVPPPQFAEGEPLSDRMNEQFNPYGEVGEDSLDPTDKIPTHVEDVSTMPRSRG